MCQKNDFFSILNWDNMETGENFKTFVVLKSEVEFAIFDSSFSPRMPIAMSNSARIGLIGKEPSRERDDYVFFYFLARFFRTISFRLKYDTHTLQSKSFHKPSKDMDVSGYLVISFRSICKKEDITKIQEALDVYAQDVHDMYRKNNWGELMISIGRIISIFSK